ncbi:MAG: OsmC family protein [Bacteroidota bacterium]|jgi:putative redox protein
MSTVHEVKTTLLEGMSFNSVVDYSHHIVTDARVEHGGQDKGPTPKPLLLTSLAGCTGMDVVSLLHKMHVSFSDFSLDVKAVLGKEHPKMYEEIHIIYRIKISDNEHDKMQKAVTLSQDKYCGVSAMLKKVCPVTWEIQYL